MIKHSFKLIWNQKRKNAYITVELFILFIVLFLAGYYLADKMLRYYEGVGCDTNNKYYIYLEKKTYIDKSYDKQAYFEKVKQALLNVEHVKTVSFSARSAPYTGSMSQYDINNDTLTINIVERTTDADFAKLYKPNLIKGRWYTDDEASNAVPPAIIDEITEQTLFDGDGLGKTFEGDSDFYKVTPNFKVVGVISHLKFNDYARKKPTIIIPAAMSYWRHDRGSEISLELSDIAKQNPQEYSKAIFSVLDPNEWIIYRSRPVKSMKKSINSGGNGDIRTTIIITIFFIINIILGMLGILGYNINKRKAEIGLRRAIGATGSRIRRLLFFEMQMITLIAIIPAIIIIVQLPLFYDYPIDNKLFYTSLASSLIFIMFIVGICVYYPAILASKIKPAMALKDE